MSHTTAVELNRYLRLKPERWSEYLFCTRDGNQLRTEGLDLEFRRVCEKVGVHVTPYQLRHSFATFFVENGGNLFVLQQLMGHVDIRMTQRYTEISDVQKKQQHEMYTPINVLTANKRIVKVK